MRVAEFGLIVIGLHENEQLGMNLPVITIAK